MITTITKNIEVINTKKINNGSTKKKKAVKKSAKNSKLDGINCQEYCMKKYKTRFPTLQYLIDNPSKEMEGNRYDNMFPTIKSAFSKICSKEINGKAWGTISREFENNIRPTLRDAIKAQLPEHGDEYIDYQTDHMIRNTVDHIILTWDENLAGNGGGCSDWATRMWTRKRREVGECIKDCIERTGMTYKEFNNLRDDGDIVRTKDGRLNIKYLVEVSDIREDIKYTVETTNTDNNNEYDLKQTKNKNTILSSFSTDNDIFPSFDDRNVTEIDIPPPIPPPKSYMDMSPKELYAIFGL